MFNDKSFFAYITVGELIESSPTVIFNLVNSKTILNQGLI